MKETGTEKDALELSELDRMRAYLAATPLPPRPREPLSAPHIPFDPLPSVSAATRQAIVAAALDANDRYLDVFLEPHSFCPFARGGRQREHTVRLVHYAGTTDIAPLLDHMENLARDPAKVVVQVLFPLIDVTPAAWERFCHDLTAVGNERLREGIGNGTAVFAVAPLHPALPYLPINPYSIIPLFRRTPDPTIQWVRLDALQHLYRGRSNDAIYVDPAEIDVFLAKPRREPLFDRIAETNLQMARRLGIGEVERLLRELSRSAQASYARLLLDDAQEAGPAVGCPHHRMPMAPPEDASCPRRRVPVSDGTPPRPAILEREGRWALARVDELAAGVGRRFLAAGVELLAIRVGNDIHVLHGRCPHRHAPLTDAVVEEDRLICPHHGWDFELATGRSQGVPGAFVARFRVWIEDGLLWIDGDELAAFRGAHVQVFGAEDDVL